ncbi:uncharacterized protein K460DRAFT_276894, partial [Cucurbitaria berberidis CBS 394.84]
KRLNKNFNYIKVRLFLIKVKNKFINYFLNFLANFKIYFRFYINILKPINLKMLL